MVIVDFHVDVLAGPQLLLFGADQNVRVSVVPILSMGPLFMSYFVFRRRLMSMSYKLQSYWLDYQKTLLRALQIISILLFL